MNFEFFLARKIHFSKLVGNKQVTPPAVRIAVIGIAFGLAIMIIAVAIVVGFKKEVRNKVIGFGSHIQIAYFDSNMSYETRPITISDTLMADLAAFPGVKHVEPFATKPGILKTESDYQGMVLKGVDENYDWSFFKSHLKEGELFTVDPNKMTTDVLISKYMANIMGLKYNDSFLAYFVQSEDEVRARKFHITGIYDTGFGDYDKLFVVADIKQIKTLSGWENNQVGGIEIFVDDYDKLDEITEQLYFHLLDSRSLSEQNLYVRSIKDLNPMIFNWLDILDLNVVILLVLLMAVAGFTMISGLLIIILERTNMIGILKALGQQNSSIRRVFFHISFFLIGKGMFWGNIIGIGVCFIQSHFKILTLDPSVYYLDSVPIDLSLTSWLLINLGTLCVSMLMMFGPSYLISKISPSRTIRFE